MKSYETAAEALADCLESPNPLRTLAEIAAENIKADELGFVIDLLALYCERAPA